MPQYPETKDWRSSETTRARITAPPRPGLRLRGRGRSPLPCWSSWSKEPHRTVLYKRADSARFFSAVAQRRSFHAWFLSSLKRTKGWQGDFPGDRIAPNRSSLLARTPVTCPFGLRLIADRRNVRSLEKSLWMDRSPSQAFDDDRMTLGKSFNTAKCLGRNLSPKSFSSSASPCTP